MLYQKLLVGEKPYYIRSSSHSVAYPNHRHPEVEFYYCAEGTCTVWIGQTRHVLSAGTLAVIGSMSAHKMEREQSIPCRCLVAEVGPVFLADDFNALVSVARENPILHLDPKKDGDLLALLQKLLRVAELKTPLAALEGKGLLYQLCALLLYRLGQTDQTGTAAADLRAISLIDQALELINQRYASPLTVALAAEQCGYSQSSFCRMFKRITGKTFHQVLNRHRIQIACVLLKETTRSVEQIAEEVGFADTKTFCRVFKSEQGLTASQYRRTN